MTSICSKKNLKIESFNPKVYPLAFCQKFPIHKKNLIGEGVIKNVVHYFN